MYDVVIEYLKEQYKHLQDRDGSLDDKAETIIKLLGSGTAIISFGTLLSLKLETNNSIWIAIVIIASLIPTIILSGFALYRAVKTREPRETAALPDVTFAINCVHSYESANSSSINIWLILHPICIQIGLRIIHKSNELTKAYWNYKAAFIF